MCPLHHIIANVHKTQPSHQCHASRPIRRAAIAPITPSSPPIPPAPTLSSSRSPNMSSSIRFTNSAKRPPKKLSSSNKQSILLNGTPVKKVTGSALRSSPRNRPSRITTHLSDNHSQPSDTSSSTSSISSQFSPQLSSSSSAPSSSSSSSPSSSPSSSLNHIKSPSSTSNSPARRPRNMHPVPEIPIPDWNQHDLDSQLPLHPDSPSSTPSSPASEDPVPTSPQNPQTFFIHNGYRYDGDVFELRPPQERSIASRPERILEHKPALLPHRQQFNRVYSEGTYNARPSSLRQMANRSSSRFSSDQLHLSTQSQIPNLDLPGCEPAPLPVTRPGSVRPGPDALALHNPNHIDTESTTVESLCESIDRVRLAASVSGDTKLQGLLAYSGVPVTKITGERPAPHITKAHHVVAPRHKRNEPHSPATFDENHLPPTREKRNRSYTSFAKSTPYVKSSEKEKDREKERRPSLWKIFTR